MKVLKFGGSSIGSSQKIKDVKKIIKNHEGEVIVVVSAFNGITDKLLELGKLASHKDRDFFKLFNQIEGQHLDIIAELFEDKKREFVLIRLNSLFKELSNCVNGIYLLGDLTAKIQDKVISFGEQFSSLIISQFIDCELAEPRNFIKTNNDFGNAKVIFSVTNSLIKYWYKSIQSTAVIPGFIASTERNETTTLGRGGSDYTAAIVAAAIDSECLEIWTDVDGFMTADPKKVQKALAIESLSYAEAMELSHFGAKVVYTPTIQPAYQKKIEILVKNTYNPGAPGTIISNKSLTESSNLIKGISSIDEINLITLQGPGMSGTKGISGRLFNCLAHNNINIILITQASSEYSITFAISPEDAKTALEIIEKEFEPEIRFHKALGIHVEKDLSIIAIVGEKMKNTPGIAATLFSSLSRNGISVIAVAQGSSELNISIVIKKENINKALNVIHEGFFRSHIKELNVYLIGVGTVGGMLLKQIKSQQTTLLKDHFLKINIIGVSNSRKMIISEEGINLDTYKDDIEKNGERKDIELFVQKMTYLNLRNTVFVDCTASAEIAIKYKEVLSSYISVVAANKIACSSDFVLYNDLKKTALERKVRFIYETNVGAGLPIINTLNDLIRSGDKIIRLEAVLSGTLNFIFNVLSEDVPFSKAVKIARESGYSEPDPRTDLSGIDVVRKILILARESGYELEMRDVKVKPFLPEDCFKGSIDDFWKKIKKLDKEFEEKRLKLVKENKKLRFVALLDKGKATVELKEVDSLHPAYALEGSNNIVLIKTQLYNKEPMIIKGYGAGAEVTAAGVFADIIRVANV